MTDRICTQLNARFAIPNALTIKENAHGMVYADVTSDACTGQIFLHGAHVTSFRPAGHAEVLFVSKEAKFSKAKAIRGGVPICFPWFGSHQDDALAPAHGWARIQEWTVKETARGENESILIRMRADFDAFQVTLVVEFGQSLSMELTAWNTTPSVQSFEVALHSYFSVLDVEEVEILGLEEVAYLDPLTGKQELASHARIRIAEEIDRIYQRTRDSITIVDSKSQRQIVVDKRGSNSTVIWNPWITKSARMGDFGNDEWRTMCCIETANIGPDAIQLGPGESHSTGTVHRVESI